MWRLITSWSAARVAPEPDGASAGAAKKEVVSDYSMVIREAKLQPMIMDVAAFTIQNAYRPTTRLFRGGVAIINVGATPATSTSWPEAPAQFTRD